jgi:hypothetical protein
MLCLIHIAAAAKVPIAVTYTDAASVGFQDPSLGADRRTAFEYAMSTWSQRLGGNIPIRVKAGWASLTGNTLAQAGSTSAYSNFTGAPLPDTYYVPSLAKQLSGEDLNGGGTDFQITYNTNKSDWYYGTDGGTPGDKTDFVSVAMHEFCHGLGFASSIVYGDSRYVDGSWANGIPNSFDQWMTDIDGWRFVFRPPGDRAPDIVSGNRLYFMGPETYAMSPTADFGHHAPLYCPTTYAGGSSASHMGEQYNNWNGGSDALMTYSIGHGESHHWPGYVGQAVVDDVGWAGVQPVTASILDPLSTTTTITLRAIVNVHGHPGTLYFHYVTSDGVIGNTAPVSIPGDNADHEVDTVLSDLPAGDGNAYYPTAIADNERGHLELRLPNNGYVLTQVPGSGTALQFNGVNQWAQTTGLSGLGSGNQPHTIEAWINPSAIPSAPAGVLMLGNQPNGSENWFLRSDGVLVIGTFGGIAGGVPLPLNAWTHVAVSFDGINHRVYINGGFIGIFPNTLNLQGNTLSVGGGQPGVPGYFQGGMDEVRVWNYQRSQGEIAANVYKRMTGSESGLVNEWRFDEATGFAVNDSTGRSAAGNVSDNLAWYPSFAPIGIPLATTGAATGISATIATLTGSVDPNQLPTAASFEWGATTAYGNVTPQQLLSGDGAQDVSAPLANLTPGTTYHFRVIGANGKDTRSGDDQVFTTLIPSPPATLAATNVSVSSATLNGAVNPGGAATDASFEWGADESYGQTTPAQSIGAGVSDVSVSFPLTTGALPQGTYHYRVKATSAAGSVPGGDQTFTLLSPSAGDALQFNGVDGDVVDKAADPANLNLLPLTVSAWIKTSDTTGTRAIVNKYVSSSDNGYQVFLENGHLAAWYFRDAGNYVYGGSDLSLDGGLVADGAWHNVAFTVDNSGGKVYVDGALKNQLAWTGSPAPTSTAQPLTLGAYPPAVPETRYNGLMDEVRIWRSALSQARIQQTMGRRLLGNEADLAAYYRLDDGSGAGAADVLGANSGTLEGGVQWVASDAFNDSAPVSGSSVFFDGFDGAIRIPNFGRVAPTSEITIEFWENALSPKQQSAFVTSPPDSANIINAHVPWVDGIVYWDFGSETNGGRLTYAPPDNYFGVWQHWAFVASQQNGGFMKIYRNGEEVASKTGANQFAPGDYDLLIGGAPNARFGGSIDEFRIWNVVRSQADIQMTMHRRLAGAEPGLFRYYRMDEDAGPAINDPFRSSDTPSSGDAITGYLLPGAYWTPSTAPLSAPFTLADARRALSLAAGLSTYAVDDARLNVEPSSPGIDIADALRLARSAAGLDPNL